MSAAFSMPYAAVFVVWKGGLVRTVLLNDILVMRLMRHLEYTQLGHSLSLYNRSARPRKC